MEAPTILLTILLILVVDFVFEELLSFLNYKSFRKDLPQEVMGIYDQESYSKSQEYNKTRTRFSFLTSSLNFLLIVGVLTTGLFGLLDGWLIQFIQNEVARALVFFGVLFLVSDLINLPFQLYSTFAIEEKFGFNKTSIKTFWLDKVKGYLLTSLIGGLVIGVLLLLILEMGQNFWLYFWAVISAFVVLLNMFYTSLIVPLFNKLSPLEDGQLKEAIQSYSKKVKFPLDQIFVIDGSKRSTKANAFFSGIGRKKKIVLFDTLIKNHGIEELVAVLAHEVGHYKKKHVYIGLVLSVIQVGFMLFIMSFMIYNSQVSLALGGNGTVLHLNIIAFGILYTPISKVTGLLMNMFSRKNEFEADEYAAQTYDGSSLQLALKHLSVDNLSNLLPHRWIVFFHYSHPPLLQRLRAIDNVMRRG